MTQIGPSYQDALSRAEAQQRFTAAQLALPKCIVCSAEPGDVCTYATSHDGHQQGDIRPEPHFYRG